MNIRVAEDQIITDGMGDSSWKIQQKNIVDKEKMTFRAIYSMTLCPVLLAVSLFDYALFPAA
jgi:hypothetical protein